MAAELVGWLLDSTRGGLRFDSRDEDEKTERGKKIFTPFLVNSNNNNDMMIMATVISFPRKIPCTFIGRSNSISRVICQSREGSGVPKQLQRRENDVNDA